MYSVRSTTGYNLRRIMLETNRVDVNQFDNFKIEEIKYHPVNDEDKWKVSVIKECIDAKFGKFEIDGFSKEQLDEICGNLCSN